MRSMVEGAATGTNVPHLHNVIPAQAGIQAGPSDSRGPALDSRLRGNDTGWEKPWR